MSIKKRSRIIEQATHLADELADKAYGTKSTTPALNEDEFVITSISLPKSMLYELEDIARNNKRLNSEPKNISALIRKAVSNLLTNN